MKPLRYARIDELVEVETAPGENLSYLMSSDLFGGILKTNGAIPTGPAL